MNLVPNSKLVAVMRRSEEKVKDYAKRHGVSKWYTDAQALVNDSEVNAIYIATPPNAHLELTKMAAAAGKPVYVEKPMARTHAECLEMIAVCEAAAVPLYVAYYRRTLPHFVKMKEMIDAGAIGEVRTLHINMKQELKPGVVSQIADPPISWISSIFFWVPLFRLRAWRPIRGALIRQRTSSQELLGLKTE
jgi:predicted dehydrogenase